MSDSNAIRADVVDDAQRDVDPIMPSGIQAGIAAPGWRLPASAHLGHVSLQVANLERSLEYYQRVLGLRVFERSTSSALLGTMRGETALVQLSEHTGAKPMPLHGRFGLYHFAILLPNRASLGMFITHLDKIGERAGASDHLVSEALYLRDPDGLGIEIYADRPRSMWRVVDRQLQMATEPLDFAAVVSAAAGRQWNGMPAGATMGHVHLHVGDLGQAATFFHVALGFDQMVWAYPGALFLAAGGYHHHLGLNTWAGANAPRPATDDARLLEWRIVLSSDNEVREAVASLTGAGHHVVKASSDWIAEDPWGTPFRLVSQR